MGISAGSLSDCLQSDIKSGKYRLFPASPEAALGKSFLSSLKKESNSLHDNLAAIVVDESRGGTLRISGWGCAARTLEPLAYTRVRFSWILLPYTRVNSPNHSYPRQLINTPYQMVQHIILADILLIARIFPRPCGARKNTTQLAKYPRVLYAKPSNKVYLLTVQDRSDLGS